MTEIRILRCGKVDYKEMCDLMKDFQKQRIDGIIGDTILFVEHPEIVTIGPKANRDEIIVDGYPTCLTDRGGGITWHGPGQLVIYPIIKWKLAEQSVKGIISLLEDWAIGALEMCGVFAYKSSEMQGAWVDGHKICSIGLSFLHWVSRHGMSINIATPENRVEQLEGCGIKAGLHTSLSQLGYSEDTKGVPINTLMVQENLISTCEKFLGRKPALDVEWSGVIVQ
ncbi:MAG: lipoyl(octanoyl) transferase [Euryarchaeota archaeon]|nr:lipoyl(octanoyl) transferase [Euryarchaeota archaeon]MBJ28835.1 lipoyl(octanoyl) transferase [Euryarchaeota archaeon]|tara:strand:- start:2525 stop:3199 length:675 start_codon:yes stop_codon:yes gene_type:complete